MFETKNEAELIALGQDLGSRLTAGQVLVLTGDLGAGKTTLTKGLGIDQMIKSPTSAQLSRAVQLIKSAKRAHSTTASCFTD